jgi:hypothetical protein
MRPSSLSLIFGIEKGRLRVNKSYHSQKQSKKQNDAPAERVAILRSGHGRENGTFTTASTYVISSTGARLLTGKHVTARAANALTRNAEAHANAPAVLPFKPRRRFQTADRRAA